MMDGRKSSTRLSQNLSLVRNSLGSNLKAKVESWFTLRKSKRVALTALGKARNPFPFTQQQTNLRFEMQRISQTF